jgi:hypothetical protein
VTPTRRKGNRRQILRSGSDGRTNNEGRRIKRRVDDTNGRRIIDLLLLAVLFAVVLIFALFLLNLFQVLLRL